MLFDTLWCCLILCDTLCSVIKLWKYSVILCHSSEVYETLRESSGKSCIGWYATQITLGVCCISQAVYMLRTKIYGFTTTPYDASTYIGQQLKCRRTCPIGWREHVCRWHVHTFWLPKQWNRQIPGWNLLRFSGFNCRIRFCTCHRMVQCGCFQK